jgi:glycosyltransferase EpsE
MNKVSVIMGIYNCEKTLSQAIESVLNQTYTSWELIMCDDGSGDHTYKIAKQYSEKYPDQIIVLKNKNNMRLAASLNRCLKVATGKYIARMDADDENLPERFEKEVAYLDSHPEVDCVGTGCIVFDDDGDRTVRSTKEHPDVTSLRHGVPFIHPTIMMRKEAYDKLGGYTVSSDTMRAEDLDLWFRFFGGGYRGYVMQEPLYRYRESLADYKKRTLQAAVGTTKVFLRGFRALNYPLYVYPCAFKPIISALVPNGIMQKYHAKRDKNIG